MCELFDQAYPQWCDYFEAPAEQTPDWRLTGYLMQEKERFQGAGLFPENLPPFRYGFSRDNEFWLYEQPSDYYRRHLMLHEGTHGFMYTRLRAAAPPWYMEGMAELLATHRLEGDKLQLAWFPRAKEEAPLWGRIKLVQDDFAANKALFLSKVLAAPLEAHLNVDAYGWCWAAAAFLHGHPRYRERFYTATQLAADADFAEKFHELYAADWGDLGEEWQLFVGDLEYGYDLERSAIEFAPGQDLVDGAGMATVAADRGWQSSRLRVYPGKKYRLKARGRYQVAREPQPWWSEPGGVSIRYHKGRPLGMLLAAVRPDERDAESPSGLFRVAAVGLETTVTAEQTGTLYFKLNDSPAELSDNAGTLEVEVQEVR